MKRCLLVVAALAILGVAYGQSDGETAFLKGMDKIRKDMDSGRWKQAADKLRGLLEDHAQQDYVRAKRLELEECVRECAFRKGYKAPKDDDLVSGKLKSYNERSGQIKIAYKQEDMADFMGAGAKSRAEKGEIEIETVRRALAGIPMIHPAVFCGPYTITMEGAKYPGVHAAGKAQIMLGLGSKEYYSVGFGCKSVTEGNMIRRIPPSISKFNGEEWVNCESKDTSPVDPGKPFVLKIKVSGSRISAQYKGKQVLKASVSDNVYGQFGINGIPLEEIEIQGKIEPAWIQGLRDAAAQEARSAFEESFAMAEHLPDWLYESKPASPAAAGAAASGGKSFPGPEMEGQDFVIRQALDFLEEERLASGLDYVSNLAPDEATEEVRTYLKALFLTAKEEKEDALECCDRVCELDPSFFETRRMQAMLHAELRMRDEAIDLYAELLEEFPDRECLYPEQVQLLFKAGRLSEAKQVIEGALRRGFGDEGLEVLNRQLTKALEGPRWPRKFDYESKHYHVFSDIDKETCFEAAQFLEDTYVAYTVFLKWIKGLEEEKFPVYIFSGKAGFMDYCEDVTGSSVSWAAGLYSPVLKQLLIWNLPQSENMMRTVRHEGFHQYLDRLMDDPPLWFNEGLAEYYEIAERKGGKWDFGSHHTDNLRTLAKARNNWVPLEGFLYRSREEFYGNTSLSYAQSWAFIHFLRHHDRETRKIFERLFEEFQRDVTNKAALDKVMHGVDLRKLQADFERHVEKML